MMYTKELEQLYDQYDNSFSKAEKRKILEEILFLDPDDIDSMHRYNDLLPEKKQLEGLIVLKQKALSIVNKYADKDDDLYCVHETRPYIFILDDLLNRYEKEGKIQEAYQILLEMQQYNPGDNLGQRFHLVAYYVGQNKIKELEELVKNCPEHSSVALRFAALYLKELKKPTKDFGELFKELPYLYALISKEIFLKKYQIEKIFNNTPYYSPNGFFESLLFYKYLNTYCDKVTKELLYHKCALYKDTPMISITSILPKNTKQYIFSLCQTYNNEYETFLDNLSKFNIKEEDYLKDKDELKKYLIVYEKEKEGEKSIYFNEATYPLAIYYVHEEQELLFYLSNLLDNY